MRKWSKLLLPLAGSFVLLTGCGQGQNSAEKPVVPQVSAAPTMQARVKLSESSLVNTSAHSKTTTHSNTVAKHVDWTKPSGGAYPKLKKSQQVWIDVSIAKQRVYIKEGNQVLYTMVTSTGINSNPDTATPKGTYHIQAERGEWFYSARVKEGAEYWVSWKNHGQYLFHSVAMDKHQHVIESEAKKLGHEASHGCLRLSIPDAKWIYDHIETGTKVVIHS